MSKRRVVILAALCTALGLVTLAMVTAIMSFFARGFVFNWQVLGVWLLLWAIGGTVYWASRKTNIGKQALKSNKDIEDTHFLTAKEIKNNAGLTVTQFSRLCDVVDGIPVSAKVGKDDAQVILAKPIHTLVIGTTGSGKTTTFVDPTIEILARTKTKPSLVITDPKGELYTNHAATLQQNGYKVLVLNLSEVYKSARWNPFANILAKQHKIENLGIEKSKNKYYVLDQEFTTMQQAVEYYNANQDKFVTYKQEIVDEIYDEMQDIIYTMCPVENQNDSTWQKGARDLIFAVALAMWEDVRDGKIKPEQLNLFNLYKTITKYAVDDCQALKAYFDTREEFSKTRGLSNTVLVTEDRTLTSYLGDVNQYMSFLNDRGIQALTSGNDIDFNNFDEQPTALFIKIPDAKDNRHKLVSLLLVQMYKALVAKAGDNQMKKKTKAEELLRTTYFILDEFGNLPKLNKIDSIITVGRSRKIFMIPIIQNFKQLDNKYGKDVAEIVKSNCNIKIFIQAGDSATNEEFSKLCGKRKIVKKSFSESKDTSMSVSVDTVPLITPYELQNLNDANAGKIGNAIVLALGKNPLKATFTPCFKAPELYHLTQSALADVEQPPFDESQIYYDIVPSAPTGDNQEKEEIQPEHVTDAVQEKQVNRDKMKALLNKKLVSLKKALKPYLSARDYDALMHGDPFEVIDLLEEIMERLQSQDVAAVVMGLELKNFITMKYFDAARADYNTA